MSGEVPPSLKRPRLEREKAVPGEVVRRTYAEEVPINISTVAVLGSDGRAHWLTKALDALSRGATRASDIYDVVSHKRFAIGVSAKLASQMMTALRQQLSLFTGEPHRSIEEGDFDLARRAAEVDRVSSERADTGKASKVADDMMARCLQFVRQNENVFKEVHAYEARTFQVELWRLHLKQVWGLTWSKEAFAQKRRILQGIVPGSPASRWNMLEKPSADRPMEAGDELVAVNGKQGFEECGCLRDLLRANMTFVRGNPGNPAPAENSSAPEQDAKTEVELPPLVAEGGYTADAGDGWQAHASGKWLFNASDAVYFHLATKSLWMEDPTIAGRFRRIKDGSAEPAAEVEAVTSTRVRGRICWFSRPKGFGFVAPWRVGPRDQEIAPNEKIFMHRSEVLELSGKPAPLCPGMPVSYVAALREGRVCASCVDIETDLASLCGAGVQTGSTGRPVEWTTLEFNADIGHSVTAAFTGFAVGRRGVGGAEFIAQRLPSKLSSYLRCRDHGGEKGARNALIATFKQLQHEFLQYAQKLTASSANVWLSAETSACTALVFGPEADGAPRILITLAGGGSAIICRHDGSVAARLGSRQTESNDDKRPGRFVEEKSKSVEHDPIKAFEHGLKGPSVSFPPNIYSSRPGEASLPEPKGFGAHAWSEKDGSAGGFSVEMHVFSPKWEEDAFFILGSEAFWQALPDDVAAAAAAHEALQAGEAEASKAQSTSASDKQIAEDAGLAAAAAEAASQRLAQVAHAHRRNGTHDDVAVSVLRFAWSDFRGFSASASSTKSDTDAAVAASRDDPDVCHQQASASAPPVVDDMFAELSTDKDVTPIAPADVDDMFTEPPADKSITSPVRRGDAQDMCVEASAAAVSRMPMDVEADEENTSAAIDVDPEPPVAPRRSQLPTRRPPLAPHLTKREPTPAMGPMNEMDDMFAQFCDEVGGVGGK